MILHPCLGCGVPTEGSRCPDCRPVKVRGPHPSTTARWKNLSKKVRRLQPFCSVCGATTNLQLDHIVPIDQKPEWMYEIANCDVLCLTHNREKSNTPASPETIAAIEKKISDRKRRRVALTTQGTDPGSTSAQARRQPQSPSHTPGGYA